MIELQGVKKIYHMGSVAVNALAGIDLKIMPADFVAITGPSGSGKSTLMHIVGCLDVPTEGKLLLDGQDVAALRESDLAQIRGKRIGFVFQDFNLVPALSALENVQLPLMFQGVPQAERAAKAAKLLGQMGLGERTKHLPMELSGGEQQRVAIARALATDPDVILADEPTGNLDTKTGENIMKVISALHDEGNKTVIIVTHEAVVARFAERIIRVRDGIIIADGANKEMLRVVA
ncbi:MAG: ABC transporter ATP-binding protein [Candidatus Micrarchaeota archaeon]|nr:ABC transporter ATP-binding protein [Candidatus Micrarchaeota archaeon]